MTVAIVTGAGRGIGAAIARRLHGDGWTLVLGDLDGDGVDALAGELGSNAVPIAMDVRDPRPGHAPSLPPTRQATSAPSSTALLAPSSATSSRSSRRSGTTCSRRTCAARSSGSAPSDRTCVIAARGGSSTSPPTPRSAAAASREPTTRPRRPGCIALTRRAAATLAPAGVTVNAVAPGTIDGETVRELAGDRIDELAAEIPAGRLGRPEEIAALVAWLLSDDAAYVNGATLLADGGAAL